MIPLTQLETLKPIQDQINRINQVKSKRTLPVKRHWLTKRARQWCSYISTVKDPKYPKGQKSYGNKPMSERK